jgi:hypothetical protein
MTKFNCYYTANMKFYESLKKLNPIQQAEAIEVHIKELGEPSQKTIPGKGQFAFTPEYSDWLHYETNLWNEYKTAYVYRLHCNGKLPTRQNPLPPDGFDWSTAKKVNFSSSGGQDDLDSRRGFGPTGQSWRFRDATGKEYVFSE